MSKLKVFDALNRLFGNQCCSVVDYLNQARPWTHSGNEELMEATRSIVADHEHYSQLLADAIEERGGTLASGGFPMSFLSLNDLALDYLLDVMIDNQQRNIETNEQCVAELGEDLPAWNLASEILGSERAHLDIMKEFLPHTEPVANRDEMRSRAG